MSRLDTLLHDVSWVLPYRNPWLSEFFQVLTWLGYPSFILIFLPLGYWLWRQNAFTRITVLVILSTIVNAFLKDLWQNPRPDIIYAIDPDVGNSFGMPSGHAQIAVVLWFGLAFEIRQRWAWMAASLLVLGIACSRIYLGVHDLEDVLAGLVIGAASLCLYRWILRPRNLPLRNKPLWTYLLALVFVQVILSVLWPAPAHSLTALSLLAFLAAWLLGDAMQVNRIEFSIRGSTWARLLVAALGVAGLLLMFKFNKASLAGFPVLLASYLSVAILGFYMTFIAPALFRIIGLGQR